jgi:AraC-like DNA-binding protein
MLKRLVALEETQVLRPREFGGEVELQVGVPAVRAWPTRVCEGFEMSLLIGPAHPATIQGRAVETPSNTPFVQMPGTVWSAAEAKGAFLSLDIGPSLFSRLVAEWPGRAALPGPSLVPVPVLLDAFWSSHRVLRGEADATTRSVALLGLVKTVLTQLTGMEPDAGAAPDAVSRVRDALHDAPERAPTIDELAQLAGLTSFELLRAFRDRYGVTPSRYLRALRVARARQLLAGGRSVGEAATELGFGSAGALRRAFESQVGLSPERYATAVA